jgi:hypothetical protein
MIQVCWFCLIVFSSFLTLFLSSLVAVFLSFFFPVSPFLSFSISLEGDPNSFQQSLRETANLTKELDTISLNKGGNNNSKPSPFTSPKSTSTSTAASPINLRTTEALIDVLRMRENRLYRSEDVLAKFLEVGD